MYEERYVNQEPSAPDARPPDYGGIRWEYELNARIYMLEKQISSLTELLVSSDARFTKAEEVLKLEIEKNTVLTERNNQLEEKVKHKHEYVMRQYIKKFKERGLHRQ
jgi:hypothetical protein